MIKENIAKIMSQLGDADLVAVTKNRTVDEIMEAISAGVRIIAENRVQEAEDKYPALKEILDKGTEFHFIGHLQTNKVKKAVDMFDCIESVDSQELANEIDLRAGSIGKIQSIMVQVNIGDEPQKSGIDYSSAPALINHVYLLRNVKVIGLMCIAPYFDDPEKARPYFRKMKKLYSSTNLKYLSMGMSHDYRIAIEEGANLVRIGTLIFGERK